MAMLLQFFYQAGMLVWMIILLSVVMWGLILTVYWRQRYIQPQLQTSLQAISLHQLNLPFWHQQQLLKAWLSQATLMLDCGMPWIRICIQILPFLGLLGTVDGMIVSFTQLDKMNVQQQLAGGISQALLTTLAGLVTSLSGLYLAHNLNRRNQIIIDQFRFCFIKG